jgi:hypothetical protein
MFKLLYNAILGQIRAKKLSNRYGIPKNNIIDAYIYHVQLSRQPEQIPTIRSFEMMLRKSLAEQHPDIKHIEPIYCKGLDPLNPYNP